MLITVTELKEIYTDKEFSKFNDKLLERKLASIESIIRRYTHNNFINRSKRVKGLCADGIVFCDTAYFKEGDTVFITNTIEDGIYTVKSVEDGKITLNQTIADDKKLMIAPVEYPIDVVDGAVELLDWNLNIKGGLKKGIASESISRHSVSYVQYNASNMIEGYPSEMFGFLTKYVEWRT